MRIHNFFPTIKKVRAFLKQLRFKISAFIFPTILSFVSALFEGLSVWLLILLVKGIIGMNFSFVKESAAFVFFAGKFPQLQSISNLYIFILLVSIVFLSEVLKNVLEYLSSVMISCQIRFFSHNLRKLIFNRYLSFGKLFFDRNRIGHLYSVLLSFPSQIAGQMRSLEVFLNRFFLFLVYFTMMCIISFRVTMLVIILFPVLHYSSQWLIRKIKSTSIAYSAAFGQMSSSIANILSSFTLVKLYTQEESEKEHFDVMSSKIARLEFSMDKKQNLIRPLQEIIVHIGILALISAMAFIFVKEKTGQIASFLVFFYILKRSQSCFGAINTIRASLGSVGGQIKEISGIFNDHNKFFIPDGKAEFNGLKREIAFRNLKFSYIKNSPIIKDVSFSIDKGKVTAIVGPTGAGKTTLMSLILRFYDSPPGTIFIDDVDIREFTLKSLMAHIAYVSQDVMLFNDTIRNNLIYGLVKNISDVEIFEVIKKARLYDFVMALPEQLNTYIGEKGIRLSGGERQRVSIARALLKNTQILILDEATSSLDSRTERLIQEAIDEAMRDKTVIAIAHRLSTIKNAGTIVAIEGGMIVECGSREELLAAKGKFYQYWQDQNFF